MAEFYDSLNIESYEIRILYLQPGTRGSTIECRLEKKSLVDLPSYAALSYCWGDSADSVEIVVNHVTTRVTANLEHALHRVRDLGVECVWVDALCINQQDSQEKSLQIRNMREIYSKADLTYCWLGDQGEDRAVDGLNFIRGLLLESHTETHILGGHYQQSKGKQSSAGPDVDAVFPHDHNEPGPVSCSESTAQLLDLPTTTIRMESLNPSATQNNDGCVRCRLESSLEALVDLFNREYWRRRWIIQEITASENVRILCGGEELGLEEVDTGLKQCRLSPFWKDSNQSACTFFEIIMELRRAYQSHRELCLGVVIPRTQRFRSRDPRDRIFALIGICSDGPQLVPTPSYHQSPECVSRDLTRSMLRKYRCFDLVLQPYRNRLAPSSLPSWAVDWFSGRIPPEVRWDSVVQSRYISRPSRDTTSFMLRGPPNTLMMRGIALGTVLGVTTSISDWFSADGPDHPILSSTANNGNARQSSLYYRTPQGVRDALAWCLASNEVCGNLPQSSEDYSVCRRYRVALNGCHRASMQGVDEEIKYHKHSVTETELAFHRWTAMNTGFLIEGECLQTLLGESRIGYYSTLLFTFWTGRFFLVTLTAAVAIVSVTLTTYFQLDLRYPMLTVSGTASILALFAIWLYNRYYKDYMLEPMERILARVARKEKLGICDNGMLAMVGGETRPGDQVCRLNGFSTFVTLREIQDEEGTGYKLIGGEAFPCLSREDDYRCSSLWSKTEPGDLEQVDWKGFIIK